jgi:hypothetical protein
MDAEGSDPTPRPVTVPLTAAITATSAVQANATVQVSLSGAVAAISAVQANARAVVALEGAIGAIGAVQAKASVRVAFDLARVVLTHSPSDAVERVQRVLDAGATDEALDQHIADVPQAETLLSGLSPAERIWILLGVIAILVAALGIAVAHVDATADTHAVDQNTSLLRELITKIETNTGPAQHPARDDLCWCGSDQKFMDCHGRQTNEP